MKDYIIIHATLVCLLIDYLTPQNLSVQGRRASWDNGTDSLSLSGTALDATIILDHTPDYNLCRIDIE